MLSAALIAREDLSRMTTGIRLCAVIGPQGTRESRASLIRIGAMWIQKSIVAEERRHFVYPPISLS